MEKKDKEKRHTKRGAQRDNKNRLNSKIDISEFLFPPNFRFCCYDSFQELNYCLNSNFFQIQITFIVYKKPKNRIPNSTLHSLDRP